MTARSTAITNEPEDVTASPRQDTAGASRADFTADLARAAEAYQECLPRMRRVAAFYHRKLRGDRKADAMAETEAFCWRAFRDLVRKGKDPSPLAGKVAEFASRRVRCGERFAGKEPLRDALSARARHRTGHQVLSLPHADDEHAAPEAAYALQARGPSPADEAIFRADWQAFLATLSGPQREVAEGLEAGLNVSELAAWRGVSRAAVQAVRSTLAGKLAALDSSERGRS